MGVVVLNLSKSVLCVGNGFVVVLFEKYFVNFCFSLVVLSKVLRVCFFVIRLLIFLWRVRDVDLRVGFVFIFFI